MITGLVYYALDGTYVDLRLKIGFTTGLRSRMAGLRREAASRQTPIVLAVEAGNLRLERQRHEEFDELRLGGEWFRYADRLVAHVATLNDPFSYLKARPDLLQYADGWCSLTPASLPEINQESDFDEVITELRGISDPLDRARAAQAVITRIEAEVKEAQRDRDEAIREANEQGNGSHKQIAQFIGAKRNIVVDAMRGRRSK